MCKICFQEKEKHLLHCLKKICKFSSKISKQYICFHRDGFGQQNCWSCWFNVWHTWVQVIWLSITLAKRLTVLCWWISLQCNISHKWTCKRDPIWCIYWLENIINKQKHKNNKQQNLIINLFLVKYGPILHYIFKKLFEKT